MGPAQQHEFPANRAQESAGDSRIDAQVGDKYRIVRKLGCGGMGSVYEAEHVVVGRRVAIKFLHEHYSDRRCMVQRFLREAKAAGSLQSDHVIGAIDYGEWQGGPYLVMDLSCRVEVDGAVETCTGLAVSLGVVVFVLATIGMAVVLVLVYRSIAEYRDATARGEPPPTPGCETDSDETD